LAAAAVDLGAVVAVAVAFVADVVTEALVGRDAILANTQADLREVGCL